MYAPLAQDGTDPPDEGTLKQMTSKKPKRPALPTRAAAPTLSLALDPADLENLRVLQQYSSSRHKAPTIRGCLAYLAQQAKLVNAAHKSKLKVSLVASPREDTVSQPSDLRVLIDDLIIQL